MLLPKTTGDWRLGKRNSIKLVLELDAGVTTDQVMKDARGGRAGRREMVVIARQLWARYYRSNRATDDPGGRRPGPQGDRRGERRTRQVEDLLKTPR